MTINKDYFANKKVIVRVDFNVPIENGIVQDTFRIKSASTTVKFLKNAGAKIILISHLGKTGSYDPNCSLKNTIIEVEKEYDSKVIFIGDCLDENASSIIDNSPQGSIILLENLRFHPEEEKCDTEFAKRLSNLADFYINEAFSVSHRKHASISAMPKFLPHAFGALFLKEIQTIDDFFENALSPKMCIVGGAKLSTKVNLLKNLVKKVDKLAIGGKIASLFPLDGNFCGISEEYKTNVCDIMENAKNYKCELVLPTDFSTSIHKRGFCCRDITFSNNEGVSDIGPDSVELFKRHIKACKTILWNGPLGLFEKPPFDFGTKSIAEYITKLTKENEIISIIGGGDTSSAMNKLGIIQDFTYVSTAGGAFLSYLEGNELAGISAMKDSLLSIDFTSL